ncbi:prepilin cleavage protein [Corallococcus sp. H22C18031201]|uniref:type IV pilus modification PilV family protein n=1 Tax=Citreicoccus inhibens TaxID=2849499 RepID=UPI000E761556|nr:prepilin cleavage protein [Citreicoccus inhibens]MBU8894407.1 prepilin cleavage protein [Citreicoccus inhibens]RJS16129.1 prepilin cleavage protein [Corallococcus sp. H22C18031201]
MKPASSSLLRRSAARRGVTLIEGLAASAILALGISGAFGGLVLASQQNTSAGRLSQASAIAQQVRAGLQMQGRARLLATTGPMHASRCSSVATVRELADGLETLPGACVIDLDAFEDAAPDVSDLVPGYAPEERELYRRVLVWTTLTDIDTVAVVVSFRSGGSRRFVKQFVALYNPAVNGAGVEL